MKNKAVIYVRLSREDEDKIDSKKESRSIENQIKTLKTFAQEQGFYIQEIYSDDGYSGADFNRPAFKRLLEDLELNKFDVILIKDLSRLGRSLHRVGELIENVFPQKGIRVISVNDKYDSRTYNDDISIVFKSFLNDYYLREFRKKCKKARQHYARTKHLNYYPKYGYCFDEDGREFVEDYSSCIVQRIFSTIANEDLSCGAVATLLNSEGILTRSAYATQVLGLKSLHKQPASKWDAEKVWSIATDYEYCGHSINWLRHNEEEKILLRNTHEKIITEELFFAVQEKIKSHSKVIEKLDHLGKYIIDIQTGKNLLFSKKQQIYFLRQNNKKTYSIDRVAIERVIFLELLYLFRFYLDAYSLKAKEKNEINKQTQREKLDYEYSIIVEQYFQGKIDKAHFERKSKTILLKINELERSTDDNLEKKILICKKIIHKWQNDLCVNYRLIKTAIKNVHIVNYDTKEGILLLIKYRKLT